MQNAKLKKSFMNGANLIEANLTDADLTGADLTKADFTGADLTNANLTDADLTGTNFTNANLTKIYIDAPSLIQTIFTVVLTVVIVGGGIAYTLWWLIKNYS